MTFPSLILLAGILTGLRANVMALFALTFAGVSLAAGMGLFDGQSALATLKVVFLYWVCLQCGYVLGLTSRVYVGPLAARFGVQSNRT